MTDTATATRTQQPAQAAPQAPGQPPAGEAFPRGPALGVMAPEVTGESYDGAPIVLHRNAGVPTVVALLGQWGLAPADAAWRALTAAKPVREGRAQLIGVWFGPRPPADADPRLPNVALIRDELEGGYSQAFGAVSVDGTRLAPRIVVLDNFTRVAAGFPVAEAAQAVPALEALCRQCEAFQATTFAPVLVAPNIFEPEFCRALIAHYNEQGGEASGFMREVDGKTVLVHDPDMKRRTDAHITDPKLRNAAQHRIRDRLGPMIKRAFGWDATRMERYIVARYGAEDAGCFKRHRDNTTPGTAHRKFAVTLNLNAEEFEGGELRFPEFGPRSYRAPTGGAVVFGCNLLHEAQPVTKGERYAFLPFLYDEEGARIREANASNLADPQLRNYRAGPGRGEFAAS